MPRTAFAEAFGRRQPFDEAIVEVLHGVRTLSDGATFEHPEAPGFAFGVTALFDRSKRRRA
jgi:hypothetical protein